MYRSLPLRLLRRCGELKPRLGARVCRTHTHDSCKAKGRLDEMGVGRGEFGLPPLPQGEGWGEGLCSLDRSEPPHPSPLPCGERERTECVAKLRRHRDALHLDHHLRLGEALHGDCGAGRKILAEQLGAQLGHAGGIAGVDEKDGHRDHVAEFRAGLAERLFDIAKRLLELGVEIAGERFAGVVDLAGVSCDIDRTTRAFSDDARRKGAFDLPGTANERFLHGPSECTLYVAWPSRTARQSRSGVAGISMCRTPRCESASTSAWPTGGLAPTQPASPAPLTPSGLVPVGTGLLLTSTALMSSARGMA